VGKQLEVLKHHADSGTQLREVRLRVADRDAVDRDFSLLERLQAVHAFDQRRFSASGRPAYDHDFAFFHFGRTIGEDLEAAVHLLTFLIENHGTLLTIAMRSWSRLTREDSPYETTKYTTATKLYISTRR